MDHIAPKTEQRTLPDEWKTITVPACAQCNVGTKGTRRLVPMGYPRLAELRRLTGKKWAEWDGTRKMLKEIGTLR